MNIDRKITLWILVVVLAVTGATSYLNYRLHVREEARSFEEIGGTLGPLVEESVGNAMLTRNNAFLEATLRNLTNVEPIRRIWLLNTKGDVRAATVQEAVGAQLRLSEAKCLLCHTGSMQGQYLRDDGIYRWLQPVRNKPACYGCHPSRAPFNGIFVIDFSVNQARAIMKGEIRGELLNFLPAVVVVGLSVIFLVRLIVVRRVNAIGEGLKRFTEGETGFRLQISGSDDLARLSEGFNAMAESISRSQDELKHYADELLSLAVSSNVVTAVPRNENIYDAVCNIAVKELDLYMAWLGMADPETGVISAVAQNGFESGYLASVRIVMDDSELSKGPTGQAVKTRIPHVMNDAENEPAYAPWREEALRRGYRSSMALPLLSTDGEVMGVLNLYSGVKGYFTRKRVRLFIIFSNQVAAAIENRTLIEDVERRSKEIVDQFKVIERSQKEWRLTFDSITDLISIHDREYRIIKANKAYAAYVGKRPEDLVNNKCFEIFHGACSPVIGCPHLKSIESNRVVTEEVVDPRTNRTFLVSVYPYHSPDNTYLGSVHIARDITDEKEREMRLIMSERLASLGQMASGIAHEINNPLASIGGCAEGLQMKIRNNKYDPKMFEEYLGIIREEVQRCKNITTGMLSFVRKKAYEKKDVDINEALDKTIEIIGFQGRFKDVDVVREYAADLPLIRGSEGELRQVFLAILTNALDAIRDAGTLTVGTQKTDDSVAISIADTGPGIPSDQLKRIFDPFFTTKSDRGGTGLGLSIAHRIVTNHRGTISVVSDAESGTKFTITLPISADQQA